MPTGGGGGFNKPQVFFGAGGPSNPLSLGGANQVVVSGFVLPYPLTFSKVGFYVTTGDAANNYDLGVYTQAGALIANIGPQHLTGGVNAINALQGAQTIQPGLYLWGFTGVATVAALYATNTALSWALNLNIATSSAGTLPASVGAVSISASLQYLQMWLQ
jgi:hypothetical protein